MVEKKACTVNKDKNKRQKRRQTKDKKRRQKRKKKSLFCGLQLSLLLKNCTRSHSQSSSPTSHTDKMAELSELDKETLREIVKIIFSDLTFINMDRIFSKIEDLLPECGILITYAKNEDLDFYDEHEAKIVDLDNKFIYILTCGLTINVYESGDYDAISEKLYDWLSKRPVQ